ncbi:MAG: ATP-binding protein [Bacillota bacterium]
MIIKEYGIRRYGPLSDSGIKKPGLFNHIYASNEEGKTLTIDALLKMLFKKNLKVFKGIKRVEEKPEGYLVLAESSQREIKFPEAGTFDQHFGLSPDLFANIFVIRDSDLSINDENSFYRDFTSRLTGLRTGEIEKLKSVVLDLGGITEGGSYQNTAPVKLKDKISRASALKDKAKMILNQLREENFASFEEELAELELKDRKAAEKINSYHDAQNREIYEKGAAALNRLKSVRTEAEKLSSYSQDEYEAWQKTVSELDYLHNELKSIEEQINEQKSTLQDLRHKYNDQQEALKSVEQDVRSAEKLEPGLAEYNQAKQALSKEQILVQAPIYNRALMVSALAFLLSLSGLLISDSWWPQPLLVVTFLAVVVLTGNMFFYLKKKGCLAALEAQLCSEAEKLGLPAENVSSLQKQISSLQKDLSLKNDMQVELENELEWQRKERERLRGQQQDKMKKIKTAEEKINNLKSKSGLDNLNNYREILNRKHQLKTDLEREIGILSSHFGNAGSNASVQANFDYWKEELDRLKIYANAAENYTFDQVEYNQLLREKEELEQQIKDLSEKMQDRSTQLRDLEKEANMILSSNGDKSLPCQTTYDLEVILSKVEGWLQQQEENRNCALIVRDMLDTIEEEEEEKVTALFGSESPVSEYFRRITAGRYKEVVFRSGENRIKTVRSDGVELDAAQLSGGAYDQLYFSIRLALGEKLMEGEKGFFILDDPFIKADPERLNELLSMLDSIASEGWQILYFSSKGEISEAFRQKISSGKVRELTIN